MPQSGSDGQPLALPKLKLAELEAMRQRAVQRLTDDFAANRIDMDAFEAKVEAVEAAKDQTAIEQVFADLEPFATGDLALAVVEEAALPVAAEGKTSYWAILGGFARAGRWVVPKKMNVKMILGGCELDFRDAQFEGDRTELKVIGFCAGMELTVPPWVEVVNDASAILGGVEIQSNDPEAVPDDKKRHTIILKGVVALGGVEVSSRLPGESGRDAKKRRKRQRIERKKQAKLAERRQKLIGKPDR